MSHLFKHEEYNRMINDLITIIVDELDIERRNCGSTTFKSKDLLKGFEPDTCFYIQNKLPIRGKEKIDLTLDPPTDLVIEIDETRDQSTN